MGGYGLWLGESCLCRYTEDSLPMPLLRARMTMLVKAMGLGRRRLGRAGEGSSGAVWASSSGLHAGSDEKRTWRVSARQAGAPAMTDQWGP